VVGEFRIGRKGQFVVPQDGRIQQWIEIPEGMEFPAAGPVIDRIGVEPRKVSSIDELDGMIVNVELLEYPEKGAAPVGRVVEILGQPGDFGVDVETVIRKHHLPNHFPPEVVEQAARVPAELSAADLEGRRDFRDMPIVTIDCARFRRRGLGRPARHWQLRAACPHRRRQPLCEARDPDRSRGAAAGHQRVFSGPRRPHAALRAFHQHLLP
jgi:Cold shock domain